MIEENVVRKSTPTRMMSPAFVADPKDTAKLFAEPFTALAFACTKEIGALACSRVSCAATEAPLSVAVIVTVCWLVKLPAVAANVADVLPAATVTDAGTVSAELLADSATLRPPVGAACVRVKAQVDLPFAIILVGVHDRALTVAWAVTVRLAVAESPFNVAVNVAVWLRVPAPPVVPELDEVAVKLAVVAAAATFTEPGTVTAVLLLDRATEEPPVGAACESVMVQVEEAPELMVEGEHCRLLTVTCALTVTAAVADAPFNDAVTVAD